MASNPSNNGQSPRRHSIPLQDLLSTPGTDMPSQLPPRLHNEYEVDRSDDTTAPMPGSIPSMSTNWYSSQHESYDRTVSGSPIDPTILQAALPPDFRPALSEEHDTVSHSVGPFDGLPYLEELPNTEYDDSDRMPLTAGAQPISGSLSVDGLNPNTRDSFQTVSNSDNNAGKGHSSNSLGRNIESPYETGRGRQPSYGGTLDPADYRFSRSTSTSGALLRAGSIVRAMSQRVVNISGESELLDHRASRPESRSPRVSKYDRERSPAVSMLIDTSYHSQSAQLAPEKAVVVDQFQHSPPRGPPPNPLKGHSLGFFSPQNRVRLWLCNLLVNPYTEPLILVLIVLQTILLAVESGPSVFIAGNERPSRWGIHTIDWVMLGLFVVFTLELIARIVVSGFFLNAAEYSTIDRQRGVRAAIVEQYRTAFRPQRQKSVNSNAPGEPQHSAFSRSFTTIMQGQQALPSTVEEQQRYQLARRAFLRHSFNRLDFVAVVSFWIAFLLGITGTENQHHIYVFKMLSCLRILRLLALTHGTAVRAC